MVKRFILILISTIFSLHVFLPDAAANNISPFETIFDTKFVIAGTGGMRGVGTGSFAVSGISGVVTKAYLYWHGPTNSPDPSANRAVTFDGQTVLGQNIGLSHDNCWGFQNSQAYRADVTAIVEAKGNGTYTLSNFKKPGGIDINGVSLIVFFYDEDFTNHRDVTIFHGNDSNISNPYDDPGWNVTLTRIQYVSGTANMHLIVGDGQNWLDYALIINGQVVIPSGQIFAGDLGPRLPGPFPPGTTGSLWDIKKIDVTQFLSPGLNTLSLTTGTYSDCLSLVVAVVELPAGAAPFVVPELTKAPNVFDFPKPSDLFTSNTLIFITDYSNAFSTPAYLEKDPLEYYWDKLVEWKPSETWKNIFRNTEEELNRIGTGLKLTSMIVQQNPIQKGVEFAVWVGKELTFKYVCPDLSNNYEARRFVEAVTLASKTITPSGVVSALLEVNALIYGNVLAEQFGILANDPPDPNFTQLFQTYFTPGGPFSLDGISPELNVLLGQELDSLYKTSSYLLGLTTTINRYGAALEAGDALSAGLQFEAFLKYLSLYDASVIETARYLNKLRQAMLESGIPDVFYDRQSIITMQDQLRMNGLPIEVREFFENLGLSPEDIDELVNRMLEYVPPDSVTGSLYSTLSDTSATLLGASSAIDVTKPTSRVLPLPSTQSSTSFLVQWSGTDVDSGIKDFTIFVSDNGGPFSPFISNTISTSSIFTGQRGHTYSFYSLARDVVGNMEDMKTIPDATTKVVLIGDLNLDGKVDCADLAIVKASFGKRCSQTGFDSRADTNKDCVVDVRDLAFVSQKLPAGTRCP